MQPIVPASIARNPNSHTEEEILSALRGDTGTRRFSFRYELLDSGGAVQEELDNVLDGKIEQNWLADIKRTANFTLRETGTIDFLSDRIKPHIRLHVPPYGIYDWVEYPQGVFLLSSPNRSIDEYGRIVREVEGYDQLQVYSDDLVSDRYTVASGVNVVTAVETVLGSIPRVVAPTTSVMDVARDWEPGTSKLKIINELLGIINYDTLSFNEDGLAIIQPYRSPSLRAPEYEYGTGVDGLMIPNVEQELDLFSVPNKWVLVVSDPDRNSFSATYTNTDPASPTSTVRRQRTIVDYRTEQDSIDSTILAAKAVRLAFEASQVFEAISFETAMMPMHSGNDVYNIIYEPLAINAKYSEHTWGLELRPGAPMSHRARRVVTV